MSGPGANTGSATVMRAAQFYIAGTQETLDFRFEMLVGSQGAGLLCTACHQWSAMPGFSVVEIKTLNNLRVFLGCADCFIKAIHAATSTPAVLAPAAPANMPAIKAAIMSSVLDLALQLLTKPCGIADIERGVQVIRQARDELNSAQEP